jgi:hypothetical protein
MKVTTDNVKEYAHVENLVMPKHCCDKHIAYVPSTAVWWWEAPDHKHLIWGFSDGSGGMSQHPNCALGYSMGDDVPTVVRRLLDGELWHNPAPAGNPRQKEG